jgi:hypothetical protein
MTKFKFIGIGLLALLGALLTFETFNPPAQAQVRNASATTLANLNVTGLYVSPGDDPASVASFMDSTGTNYVVINPTNAALQFKYLGTLYTGVLATNVNVTNATGTRTLVIKNGLVVQVQ